jgi:hypothetical protein
VHGEFDKAVKVARKKKWKSIHTLI